MIIIDNAGVATSKYLIYNNNIDIINGISHIQYTMYHSLVTITITITITITTIVVLVLLLPLQSLPNGPHHVSNRARSSFARSTIVHP